MEDDYSRRGWAISLKDQTRHHRRQRNENTPENQVRQPTDRQRIPVQQEEPSHHENTVRTTLTKNISGLASTIPRPWENSAPSRKA